MLLKNTVAINRAAVSERVNLEIVSIEKLHNEAFKSMYDLSLKIMARRENNRKAAGRPAARAKRLAPSIAGSVMRLVM